MSFLGKSSFSPDVDYFGFVFLLRKFGWKINDHYVLMVEQGLFELLCVAIGLILFKLNKRRQRK